MVCIISPLHFSLLKVTKLFTWGSDLLRFCYAPLSGNTVGAIFLAVSALFFRGRKLISVELETLLDIGGKEKQKVCILGFLGSKESCNQ